jgi:hypothetical protein
MNCNYTKHTKDHFTWWEAACGIEMDILPTVCPYCGGVVND